MAGSRSIRLALAGALVLIALSVSTALAAMTDHTVTIQATAFSPVTLTIVAGDRVVWSNVQPKDAHTATADEGSFDTGLVQPGQKVSVTFLMSGTFSYTCQVLPSMKGTIVVTEAAASPTPTPHRPPPTDTRPRLAGDTHDPTGLLLGMVLLVGVVGIASMSSTRRKVARARASRWSVPVPGDPPQGGGPVGDGDPEADPWIADDRSRG